MVATRIVVAGGSGFLGSRVCQAAVARGWEVVSLSRHGEPSWDTGANSPTKAPPPRWAKSVEWAKADLLEPGSYSHFLKDASAVVHTMGILLEADYKSIVQGKESPITGLQKLFGLQQKSAAEQKAALDNKQITYGTMNRDSATMLAKSAFEEGVSTFVYISASSGAPVIPPGYINSKREAESAIISSLPDMRSIFVRPTFMYDSSRKFTMPIALSGIVGSEVNQLTGGKLSFLGAMVEKPLKVATVGEAVIESIDDKDVKGIVGPKKIESLATKGWRKTML